MTPQEQELIRKVAGELRAADRSWTDPDAVRLIQAEIATQPGFAYLLTQRVIVQELALQQAQQRIAELDGRTGRGFLGGAAGGFPQATPVAPPQSGGSAVGGFLRTAAAAAAGTVAANLIYDGISHYFHAHGGGFLPPVGTGYDLGNVIPPAYDESPPAFLPPAEEYAGSDFTSDDEADASGGDFSEDGNYDDPADWEGGGGDAAGGDW